MPYIGNQPAEQFTSFATQTFSVSATTSYTLDHAVTNENEIALFINNVRQQPGSGKAYTASGTALTLSAATASTDTMYCVFLGRALQTVTPSTNSITSSMLGSNFFTGATDVGGALADADLLLIDDGAGGTLRKTAMSRVKTYVGGGITVADTWRISANASGTGFLTANWERDDTYANALIGSGMSESSGVFTFPSTGIYKVNFATRFTRDTATPYVIAEIHITTDNSSYNSAANGLGNISTANHYNGAYVSSIFDITNTSTHKVKFKFQTNDTGVTFDGNSSSSQTYVQFIRLGDT